MNNDQAVKNFILYLDTYQFLQCQMCERQHSIQFETNHFIANEYHPILLYSEIYRDVASIQEFGCSSSNGAYFDGIKFVGTENSYEISDADLSIVSQYEPTRLDGI